MVSVAAADAIRARAVKLPKTPLHGVICLAFENGCMTVTYSCGGRAGSAEAHTLASLSVDARQTHKHSWLVQQL